MKTDPAAVADPVADDAVADVAPVAPVAPHGYISDKDKYLARLKRIEGQARGIARMVDEEQYCIDILTQVSAVTKALEGVALALLDDHLRHCVVDAARKGDAEADIKIKEASDAIARLVRS
jgi:DNA-binding FrmR family transcriptional regulator